MDADQVTINGRSWAVSGWVAFGEYVQKADSRLLSPKRRQSGAGRRHLLQFGDVKDLLRRPPRGSDRATLAELHRLWVTAAIL